LILGNAVCAFICKTFCVFVSGRARFVMNNNAVVYLQSNFGAKKVKQ